MKYSEKQKLSAVEAYMEGPRGLRATALSLGVGFDSLRKWVAVYREHGKPGLQRRQRRRYTPEFKLEVLNRVRDEGLSYRQAAAIYDIRRFDVIGIWKRALANEGPEGLISMPPRPRKRRDADVEREPSDRDQDNTRSRQELLDELSQLRMEVAYLKKAKALVRSKTPSAPKNGRGSCSN
jgi:transposase